MLKYQFCREHFFFGRHRTVMKVNHALRVDIVCDAPNTSSSPSVAVGNQIPIARQASRNEQGSRVCPLLMFAWVQELEQHFASRLDRARDALRATRRRTLD